MEFFDSSDKAKNLNRGRKIGESKYHWIEVPIGKSFVVPRENIKFAVLRSLCSRTGKKLGRLFRAIDHGSGPYEVACLPMTDKEASQRTSNVVEALQNTQQTDQQNGFNNKPDRSKPDQFGLIYDEKGMIIKNVNIKDEE